MDLLLRKNNFFEALTPEAWFALNWQSFASLQWTITVRQSNYILAKCHCHSHNNKYNKTWPDFEAQLKIVSYNRQPWLKKREREREKKCNLKRVKASTVIVIAFCNLKLYMWNCIDDADFAFSSELNANNHYDGCFFSHSIELSL